MPLIRRVLCLCTAILILAGCTATIPRDYAGHDAGYLVVALGASTNTRYSSYTLKFRKRGEQATGSIRYLQENLFSPTPRDFDDSGGNGFVAVQALSPGDYEIYNFDIFFNGGMVQTNYGSREDFSIPFSIAAGRATYLGDFTAIGVTGNNIFGMSVRGGAYFLVSDKKSRDLPIARAKNPAIRDVDVALPDVPAVKSPFIQARLNP